jgi:hypothetical protein
MAVEDRFYMRKERFGWWSDQQRDLPAQTLGKVSAARSMASELSQIAARIEANLKIIKSVKQQDFVGTNQKVYDAVFGIHEDLGKLRKYDIK